MAAKDKTTNGHATGAENGSVVSHQEVDNVVTGPLLPHLESLERMMKLPVVEAAWTQGQGVYGKVKGANAMLSWALGTAESTLQLALATASPLIHKIDGPIQMVDQTLVKGLEKLETTVPLVKEPPQVIFNQTKTALLDRKDAISKTVQENVTKVCEMRRAGQEVATQKAQSLKELSWMKANEVLATQYGNMAVQGIDSTSALAEKLLDYYFPAGEEDVQEAETADAITSAETDRVLHTVQTVGQLSNKVARRVYRTVSHGVRTLNKQDLQQYVASLIAVLRLTQYLSFINDKVQALGGAQPALPTTSPKESTEVASPTSAASK